jgi:hypothetical protein
MGLRVDGGAAVTAPVRRVAVVSTPIGPGGPWRDRRLLTQAAAAALSLFAQVGLIMQLFSLLVPALGQSGAGVVLGFAPALALGGRSITARLMRPGVNRRLVGMGNGIVQISGSVALLLAAGRSVPLLVAGSLLFGLGIGTTSSMPPLIAQGEFTPSDLPRAVALVMGISQGCFAFAPLVFGALRITGSNGDAPLVFAAAAILQMGAVTALWLGISRPAAGLVEDLS